MASDPKKLAKYIADEIVAEFKLGQSNQQLNSFAAALSRAIHTYSTTDLEVRAGIQVDSQFSTTTPGALPEDPAVTTITKVKGKTTTAGDVF